MRVIKLGFQLVTILEKNEHNFNISITIEPLLPLPLI